MAVWLRYGSSDVGLAGGVVRRADHAYLIEAIELAERSRAQLADAEKSAQNIVANAKELALQVLQKARQDGEALMRDAHERGLKDAAQLWAEEAAKKAFTAHQSAQRASGRLAEIVSLAVQRVVDVEDKKGLFRRALRTVSEITRESKTLVLHIGAADAEYARSVVAELAAQLGIEVPLEIKVDTRLDAGGCVLESDFGVIDASLGLQLEAVRKAISNAARAALASENGPLLPGETGDGR